MGKIQDRKGLVSNLLGTVFSTNLWVKFKTVGVWSPIYREPYSLQNMGKIQDRRGLVSKPYTNLWVKFKTVGVWSPNPLQTKTYIKSLSLIKISLILDKVANFSPSARALITVELPLWTISNSAKVIPSN